ncbi:shikimate dehydrogenase [Paramesorhizobium deserti]|uniref:Shikimate dehydrogenase (NADP(+)) n=1 Tax=Paramesorhizobium deserti TaxID=1494590 RepID=A0A135I1C8_9HYPH|nr:shikimate dehydrogenase [Paramesorhizobium deserti]KXF79247.1 shikimate dehydrogenase [Paramesorhizobium deserti]
MAEPVKAFVTGFPIRHSRSPLIHGFWLKAHGLEGSYEAIETVPEAFPAFIASLRENGYAGGNVTIPHKEAAFALCEAHDAAAEGIGAVNTLWFEQGRLHGGNTDAYGFAANLDEYAEGWDSADTALVLGAGGASRAIVHALKSRGFTDIHIVNRTPARAEELAAHFGSGVSTHGLDEAQGLVAAAGLIVNTTPLGMEGHGKDGLTLDLTRANPATIVTDIVYVPLETPFLRTARDAGLKSVDGLGMLLHQAAPGFERWFGLRPEVTSELRARILADMAKPKQEETAK